MNKETLHLKSAIHQKTPTCKTLSDQDSKPYITETNTQWKGGHTHTHDNQTRTDKKEGEKGEKRGDQEGKTENHLEEATTTTRGKNVRNNRSQHRHMTNGQNTGAYITPAMQADV